MADVEMLGPPAEAGPLPLVVYFALSAHDSLHTDPFNQPAVVLTGRCRVASITLPGHDVLPPTKALSFWAEEMRQGRDIIEPFFNACVETIDRLTRETPTTKVGVMGLSRGVFVAAHVAARSPHIQHLVGFAPLTTLSRIVEFQGMDVDRWALHHLDPLLFNRSIRCYIGNHDTRVGSRLCSDWILKCAETAAHHQMRSPLLELIISPSIGRDGHGTSPEIFKQGAAWLQSQLEPE